MGLAARLTGVFTIAEIRSRMKTRAIFNLKRQINRRVSDKINGGMCRLSDGSI